MLLELSAYISQRKRQLVTKDFCLEIDWDAASLCSQALSQTLAHPESTAALLLPCLFHSHWVSRPPRHWFHQYWALWQASHSRLPRLSLMMCVATTQRCLLPHSREATLAKGSWALMIGEAWRSVDGTRWWLVHWGQWILRWLMK